MQGMVQDTLKTSAGLLESASRLEVENKRLKTKVKEEQDKYEQDMEKLKREEAIKRQTLKESIMIENEK